MSSTLWLGKCKSAVSMPSACNRDTRKRKSSRFCWAGSASAAVSSSVKSCIGFPFNYCYGPLYRRHRPVSTGLSLPQRSKGLATTGPPFCRVARFPLPPPGPGRAAAAENAKGFPDRVLVANPLLRWGKPSGGSPRTNRNRNRHFGTEPKPLTIQRRRCPKSRSASGTYQENLLESPSRSETHRRGGACGKLAGKRRSRRTGDPETAPSWTPSLQFARGKADTAAIFVAAEWPGRQFASLVEWTGRQFASGRRRHLAACRRETRRLLSDSQNGRLDLNGCPQERCARGPAATGRPRAGRAKKNGVRAHYLCAELLHFRPQLPGRRDVGAGRGGDGERGRRGEGEKRRGGEEERGLLLVLRRGGGLCFEIAYAVSRFARSNTSMRTRSMRRRVASKTVRRTFRQTSCSPGAGTWPNSLKTKPPMVS